MPEKTEEALKNCPACKKVVKKAKRFYRNGKYYCNANCYRKAQNTPPAEKAA